MEHNATEFTRKLLWRLQVCPCQDCTGWNHGMDENNSLNVSTGFSLQGFTGTSSTIISDGPQAHNALGLSPPLRPRRPARSALLNGTQLQFLFNFITPQRQDDAGTNVQHWLMGQLNSFYTAKRANRRTAVDFDRWERPSLLILGVGHAQECNCKQTEIAILFFPVFSPGSWWWRGDLNSLNQNL